MVQDYLSESAELSSFMVSTIIQIISYEQMGEKANSLLIERFVDVLKKQNQAIDLSDLSRANINSLESTNTFTKELQAISCVFLRGLCISCIKSFQLLI